MKKIITNTAAKTAVLFSLFLIASGSVSAQSVGVRFDAPVIGNTNQGQMTFSGYREDLPTAL